MIPRVLPALMVKPEFGSMAAQLLGQRRGPRPAGLCCPSLVALKGGFPSAPPSPSASPAVICPKHLLLPAPACPGPAEAARGRQLSLRSRPCASGGFAESPQAAGGGAPPAQRGAAAAGPVAWQPPLGAAPLRSPQLPGLLPSRLSARARRCQRHRAARLPRLGHRGLPGLRAAARLPHLRRPRARRWRRAGSALLPLPSSPAFSLPSPCLPPARRSAGGLGLSALPGYRERVEMFCVEVEAAGSSSWRWRARSVVFCPSFEGTFARLRCRSLTWAYVRDNWKGTELFIGRICNRR